MLQLWKTISFALLLSLGGAQAPVRWTPQQSGTTVRLRGASAVNSRVAWVSGERGSYARTVDGGRTWQAGVVPGAEELDFRDVDAFDEQTAYLLSIGEGDKSRIYKTEDGGRSWRLQFQNRHPSAFFDAMAFWNRDHGLAMSDPVGGRFLVITTSDGGRNWRETPAAGMPPALEGEGAFAASGTCVAVWGRRHAWFGTGGPGGARVFRSTDGGRSWRVAPAPLAKGKTAGLFSLAFWDARRGVAVGGDYTKENETGGNVALTHDGGRTWEAVAGRRPGGYRSGVAVLRRRGGVALVAVGPNGSDYSLDGGRNWTGLGREGYHTVSLAPRGEAGWAAGEVGRVAAAQ
jgi:photosystem II stability/assembly factor-like uncharacterized protein